MAWDENIEIYYLKLHEQLSFKNRSLLVTRVPGGWIYQIDRGDGNYTMTFVQYDNQFYEAKPK